MNAAQEQQVEEVFGLLADGVRCLVFSRMPLLVSASVPLV